MYAIFSCVITKMETVVVLVQKLWSDVGHLSSEMTFKLLDDPRFTRKQVELACEKVLTQKKNAHIMKCNTNLAKTQ